MYKGIAGSEGIGIGKVVIIEEKEINIETKKNRRYRCRIKQTSGRNRKIC